LWVLDSLGNRRLAYTSSIDSKRNFRIIAHKNHYYAGGTDYYDGWGHGEIDVFGADLQLKTTLELDYADYGPKYFSQFLPWDDTLHAIFYFGDVFAPNANSDSRYFDTHVTNSSITVGNIFGPYCSGGYNSNVVVLDDTTCALVNYCGRPFELKRYNRKFQEYESDVILFGTPFNHFPSHMGNIFVTPTKRIGGNGVYTNGPNSLKTQETWLFLTEPAYQLNSPTKPNTNGPQWAINVFPNPFSDYINIETKGLLWDMDYSLYQMLSSSVVKQGSVSKTQGKAIIITDDLKPGIYFLRLHYNQNFHWYKLIK
jgi:hypothetical protein